MARLANSIAWLLAVAASAALLYLLAQAQLGRHWRQEAIAELGVLGRGDTPFHWKLDQPVSLVGRRVFGECAYRQDAQGLLLRAGSEGCEIGLALPHPLDLSRFGQLGVIAHGGAAASLVLRPRLDQPQQRADLPAGLQPGVNRIDLASLAWRGEAGQVLPAPRQAAMLRLRLGRLTQDLRLRQLDLWPSQPWPWPQSAPPVAAWRPLAAPVPAHEPALFVTEHGASPERLLQQRDALREREPAALLLLRGDLSAVIEAGATAARQPPAAAPDWPRWLLLLAATALLAWLRLRPPGGPRLHAALRAAAVLALPLYLIAGLQLGDNLDVVSAATLAVALLFAASLAPLPLAPAWRWLGGRRAWLLSALAPLLALGLVAGLGQLDPARRDADSLAVYALWALLQQFLICRLFADRLRQAGLAPRWTVLLAALAFALLHAPNAALMLATFAGGLLWTGIWLHERALLPLAISHALAASLLVGGLPATLLRSAEVSLRYYL